MAEGWEGWGLWLDECYVASGEESQGIWQVSLMSVVSEWRPIKACEFTMVRAGEE